MARKKAKRTAGKRNPLAALKSKLAKINADLKAVKAKASDAAKRAAALEKAQGAAAAAPKAAKKKAGRKKRRAAKKAK